VSVHQSTISTSNLIVLLREGKAVEACELKKNKAKLFWIRQVWTQLQIEIVAVFEVLILLLGFFFLETREYQGLLTVHGINNIT
jgi:hypothetical protein